MKKFLAILSLFVTLVGFSLVSTAATVPFNLSEWSLFGVSEDETSEMWIKTEPVIVDGKKHAFIMLHSFVSPSADSGIDPSVRRMISEGILDCKENTVTAVEDIATTEDFTIVATTKFGPTDRVIKADDTSTMTGVVLDAFCRDQ